MKAKCLLTVVCGFVAGLTALANGFSYSANVHGMIKVEAASSNVLIAVPWTQYTPNGAATTNLPVDRLVWPKNLDEGDLLMSVTADSLKYGDEGYWTWTLRRDKEGAGRWERTLTVTDSNDTMPAADAAVARGLGLWLLRKNPKDGEQWKPFYLYGQYATGPASVTISGGSTNAVMVANPCCLTVAVNGDIVWTGVGATDTLSIPNGSDAWDLALWDVVEKKWYVSKSELKKVGKKTIIVTTKNYDLSIPAGQGFWYIRRATGDITITFNNKP